MFPFYTCNWYGYLVKYLNTFIIFFFLCMFQNHVIPANIDDDKELRMQISQKLTIDEARVDYVR